MKILLATNNLGKQKEIRALLRDLDVDLFSPQELDLMRNIKEDGETYRENAALKAKAYAKASGLFSLADDSGLEVVALEGAPGLYSARYAPVSNPTDRDRRQYLLKNLEYHPRPWKARFRCVAAFSSPDGDIHYTEGVCPGEIIPEERGEHGFGYDPIFLLPQKGRTMAELSMYEKNQLSHRALAIQALRPVLLNVLKENEIEN